MGLGSRWTRRKFLAVSGVAATDAAAFRSLGQTAGSLSPAEAQKRNALEAARAMPPAGVITGGIQPLMQGMTVRPLRYKPVGGEFVIRNGKEFFNRPIYSVNSPTQSDSFRVDAGDLPEFSMYLPGHGGNLKLGFVAADGKSSKWGADADEVVARYRPGRMIYEIRDRLLGKGVLRAELLTTAEGAGYMVKVECTAAAHGTRLAWAFAGVSGRKGQRNGDIGCERQPVSQFFQVRPEECDGNHYEPTVVLNRSGRTERVSRVLTSPAANLLLTFPAGSRLDVESFSGWDSPPRGSSGNIAETPDIQQPILTGSVAIGDSPLFLTIHRLADAGDATAESVVGDLNARFSARSAQVEAIAQTWSVETTDDYMNAAGGAFGPAAETVWDQKNECVLHGGVAWRTMLAGWRGPYCLDAMGHHDRARQDIRHWLKRQNTMPVTTGDPATGPWDPNVRLTRKEKLLHSNGDVSNNHYDMNMVFIDMTLRHLMWTGDLEFAREIWPSLQRHLAWEHRLFRRTYTAAGGKELPLYEAYAAIWASDNLQYNGGGAAHSSAYNIFALRKAAQIAKALGEDGSAYESEARLIHEGMQELLWIRANGAYAESKDLMEPQRVYTSPALWTVYHTIDSEVATQREAWQMAAERLAALRHIPIHGPGVPDEGLYMLSCSDWLPYMWSLNLLLLAENAHMALALWQTGMREEAYRIFKGSLLDSMYMGLCPGDFHMTSALDVHRQEAQRDFADPLGICSRALVEGLFGVQPDLLTGEIHIRPGFPDEWNRASLKHKDFDLAWKRVGLHETYEFVSRFSKPVSLTLHLPARTTSLPTVTLDGVNAARAFDEAAVGQPMLVVCIPARRSCRLDVVWHGRAPASIPKIRTYQQSEELALPGVLVGAQIDDPQECLAVEGARQRVSRTGFHTVFANIHEGDARWSLPISFRVEGATSEEPDYVPIQPVPLAAKTEQHERISLSGLMKHKVTEIFMRVYSEPRSEYCSLAFADNLLGGWANPEGRAVIDDAGLRAARGLLRTDVGVDFATPEGDAPNCAFVSCWKNDERVVEAPLKGRARGIYLLMAGSTLPQCSRMQHGTVTVNYASGGSAKLALRNPETWWPIEQDYLLDDYLFVNEAPLPPRVDLRTGMTRILEPASFHGKGRTVPGGAATILYLPLDSGQELSSLRVEAELYGVVIGLLAGTLVRA